MMRSKWDLGFLISFTLILRAATRGNESDYYLSFADNGGTPSVLIMTTDSQPVTYHIRAPGIRYHRSGTVTADNEAIVSFPSTAEVTSHIDQNKGIYLKTNSSSVTIIGQNKRSRTTDTFLAQPTVKLSVSIYVYYGISVPRSTVHSYPYHSSVLLVGTEDNTIMMLIVTQSVTISVGATTTNLTRGRQYSFVINRLQTVYIESLEDLTGTKIVTDKPISVFSGHECANVPSNTHACDHLVEQIPPTILWGQVYYTAPLAKRQSYTIKILAAHNSTNVTVNCGNMSVESYMINEREIFSKTLQSQEYCAINSNKIILVVQFSHGRGEDGIGDPMMTLVPATSQYDHKFKFSTVYSPYHDHYVNIVVIAQYYQPDIIYLTEGKINRSLKTQHWVPITVNNVTEAYVTQVKITEGVVEIVHSNSEALMTTIVYGFSKFDGYGHPGGLNFLKKISGPPVVTVMPSIQNVEVTLTATFTTMVTGVRSDNFTYQWRHNETIISEETEDTLMITNIVESDSGEYECIVTNQFGDTNTSPVVMLMVTMVDVSAQASCTITPINPTTLIAASGVVPIANGTENAMIRCNCSEDDGSVITSVRWYGPDGSIVPRIGTDGFIAGAPHHTRANGDSDNRNITLVIPTFNNSYDGNYTCGRRSGDNLVPPIATVNLIIGACSKVLDIAFMIDSSGSLDRSDFERALEFVKTIVYGLNIYSDGSGSRVAVLSYSSDVNLAFDLNDYYDKDDIIKEIAKLTYFGDDTYTHLGLQTLATRVFQTTYGARSIQEGIPRIAFILTDGRATVDSEQDAKKLKGLDVNVYAIGIGNVINVGALERIASSPADQYVSRIKNYHSIPTLVSESLTKICKTQASCTITPIHPTTLTTTGGILPNGTENVMIRCNCSENDGSVITNIRWHKPDGNLVPRFGGYFYTAGAPYHTRSGRHHNNREVTLVIPTFNDSYDGNYICGRRNGSGFQSPIVTVNLTIGVPTPTVTISPSGPIQGAMVGSSQDINCTVNTVSGVQSSLVMISWMGPGGVITNDSRVTISPTTSSGNNYTSSLQFTYLMEGDEGNYTCNVMISEASGNNSTEIQSLSIPTPTVSVTAPNTQTVGQSLTLQCNVTTVRGITSRVGIVWSSGGTELERMNDVSSTTMDNSLVYTDSYTISQLSTTDEGRVIQCEVVINASPPVMANNIVRLDVMVPNPDVNMSAPSTQTVGQSLKLQCEVTTVRGITGRVDIVWSSDGTELERMNDVSSTTLGNSLVYTDSYNISRLSTTDEDRVIQCEVVINASPSVMASDSITLDVTVSQPSVDISRSVDNPNVGDNLILNCTVTVVEGVSPSLVMVQWSGGDSLSESPRVTISDQTKNGLQYTRMITFSPLLIGDSGEYTCSVSVTGFDEADDSDSVLVVVNGPPVVTVMPSSQSVELTLNATFTTMVTGVGPFTYQWRHNGTIISGETEDTLMITNVMESDSGEYECIVTNLFGDTNTSNVVMLMVTRTLPVITQHPMNMTINLVNGITNTSLTCEADGASSYRWEKHNDVILSDSIGVNTNTLTLINLQPEDAGNYRCVATNASGSSESNYANLTINVPPPRIIVHPMDITRPVTQNATFVCVGQGYGSADVIWYTGRRNSERFPPHKSIIVTMVAPYNSNITSTLTIPNLTDSDGGHYWCRYINSEGQTNSTSAKLTIAIIPPVITTHPMDTNIKLYSNFTNHTLTCKADGASSYRWERQNDVIPSDSTGVNTNTLTLINLQPEDAGNYRCVATNASGSNESNYASLTISISPPIISEQPNNMTINFYESVLFKCSASGFGELKILWKRIDHNMPSTINITEEKSLNKITSILKITKATNYYNGQYCCVAENEVGKAMSQPAHLQVQVPKPEMIISPKNVTVLSNGNFTMNCLALSFGPLKYDWSKRDGTLPQTAVQSYIHNILFDPLSEQTTSVYNLAVYNVQPSDEGWYCCVATNEAGSTPDDCAWLEVNITTRCPPRLDILENGNITTIEADGITKHIIFNCNPNYLLQGKSSATCNNGVWSSSTPPRCVNQKELCYQ